MDTKYFEKRLSQLKSERADFESHWKELSEYIEPRSSRFVSDNYDNGKKKHKSINNNTATVAVRILSSGMMSGLTSPSRPWFKLAFPDKELMEHGPAKVWLWDCENIMRDVFSKSNIYNTLQRAYHSLAVHGTGAFGLFEDGNGLRCTYFPVGSYYLAVNHKGVADVFYREFKRTVEQLVNEFGIDNVSDAVQGMYKNNSLEDKIEIVHVIEPNIKRDSSRLDAKNKPYISAYYEKGQDKFLSVSGFDTFPIMAPRWDLTCDEDVYGASPGMEALGDIKVIQKYEARKYDLIAKGTNPPLMAPESLRTSGGVSALPGEITYVNRAEGVAGIMPMYEPNPNWLAAVTADIKEHEERVNQTFYKDIFLMIANDQRANVTATEIVERKEEKMLMLGPVIERLENELLTPLVERTFNILYRQKRLPEPPTEIQNIDMKVEYISIIAQAQKAVATASIERTMGFVGNLFAVDPNALDKINTDAAINEYSDLIGAPPTMIRSDEEVAQIRQQKAQAAQAQEQMALMQQGVQSAKVLADTDTGGENALTAIVGGMGA